MKPLNLSLLIVSSLLLACASPGHRLESGPDMASQAYTHIHEHYIDSIHAQLLFEAALENVAQEHPAIAETVKAAMVKYRPADDEPSSFRQSIHNVFREILASHADIPGDTLSESAVMGMASVLDKYSQYIKPEDAELYKTFRNRPGIGINSVYDMERGEFRIFEVYKDSPADKSGLRVGDEITRVNGKSLKRLKPGIAKAMLRGEEGKPLTLFVRRKGYRGEIRIDTHYSNQGYKVYQTIYKYPTPNYLYIRYRSFYHHSRQDFQEVLTRYDKRYGRKKLKGIILDLRANPGGTLNDVVPLMDLFIRNKTLVYVDGRHPEDRIRYAADDKSILEGMNMVILVDHQTAGAAELLAQSLHDNRSAVTLGRETLHYGGIRNMALLSNGGVLSFTVGKMFLGDGWDIDAKGVQLDLCSRPHKRGGCENGIDLPAGKTDPSLQWAIRILDDKQKQTAARSK